MAHIENKGGEPIGAQCGIDLATEIMVSAQMKAARLKVPAKRRYAEILVRAAIRRDGYTDAGQRLVLSDVEREQWERLFPLED